jgi:hypothetical protein
MSEIESQTQNIDAANVAAPVEQTQNNEVENAPAVPPPEIESNPSMHEKMKEQGQKNKGGETSPGDKKADKGQENPDNRAPENGQQPEPPAFKPNFKYKAFGKEKELDPFWQGLVKDPESEKRVKEVFTRADAFDDMKQRYESASGEFQRVAKQHQELDRDVKRVMHFRNSGDLDNFFASVQLSKDDIFNWAARQIELQKLSPDQQQAYQQGVSARAQNVYNEQQYATIQAEMAQQRSEMMQLQLDHTLSRSEVQGAASSWDARMGDGAFRALVIDEAAKNTYATGQVWTPDEAVKNVMQKFGKLLENPPPQATAQAPAAQPHAHLPAPQAPQTVAVQGVPVIPNVQGRGTSPVKQAPKSLAQLREMGRQAHMAEVQPYEG